MAESAAAAVAAATDGYKEQNADQVLEQFHGEALIVGSREAERWESPEAFREALERELSLVSVEGPLTETGSEEAFIRPITDNVAAYHRDGYMMYNDKRIRGRWSAILRADDEGDWKIVHSHFSLPEGQDSFGEVTSA
jgi:hypothetical protein